MIEHQPPPGTLHLHVPCGHTAELAWMDAYALGIGMVMGALGAAIEVGATEDTIYRVIRDSQPTNPVVCWHIEDQR